MTPPTPPPSPSAISTHFGLGDGPLPQPLPDTGRGARADSRGADMIAAVRGILAGKTLDSALVNVGGVTLRIFAPLSVLSHLNAGEEVTLHTWLLVREDALALYGFASPDDRDLFEQLLAV